MTQEHLVQWSYGTKLENCSNDKGHKEDCDGNCGQHTATKGQVDLHNEIAIWSNNNMPIVGKPAVIASQIPIPGFPVEILSTDKRQESLLQYLVDKGVIDEEEFLEFHRVRFTEFLREAREKSEKKQAKASIVIPHVGLGKDFGNGELH
jgi:hypothetical protein